MRSKTKAPRTTLIGFLAASLDDPYQYEVWRGASAEAEQLGLSVVFFSGQRIGSPVGYEALDNIAFDLAARGRVSALVIMANVIGTYLNKDELSTFIKRFTLVPIVSVGVEFPGIRSVSLPNEGGLRAVADHLVSVHGRRRFLFLAGPKGHSESAIREAEFRDRIVVLLGGEASPVVEYGTFQDDDAYNSMKRLMAEGNSFDAVVAANDLMAMGAIRALSEARITVPRDVSVTGFDDTEDSRFCAPPLTTVRQPTYELGREAIRRVARDLGILSSENDGRKKLAVSFVIRESCGCPGHAFVDRLEPKGAQVADDAACDDPLSALAGEVNKALVEGRDPAGFRLRGVDAGFRDRALLVIAEGEARYQASLRRNAERRAAVLREIEASLVSSFALTDILTEVARGTRTLGISACWLALFDSRGATPDWARLVLSAEGEKLRILAPYGIRFRTAELIPGGLPEQWNAYVCEPLRFGEERLGYLVCTADGMDRRVFEALRDQASGAIKGALLMTAERDRERRLEHEVRLRTIELSATNERLRESIDRRIALERELLEISNDIMGRIGRDIHDDLCQNIAGISLMAALLEGNLRRAHLPDATNAAAEIAREASRTASKAKGMARGLYPAELGSKGLSEAVGELVRSARTRSDARIDFEVTPGFFYKDSEKALQLYRIVQEALNNAVAHSGAAEIIVALRMDRESVLVEVSDDGIGIDKHRGNEHGMGIRIMKYRASVIGGEFRIRSKDRGSSISCRLAR